MESRFLNDMEFEKRLNELGDNQSELLRFVARQQYLTSKLCPIHTEKIKGLENREKKVAGTIGGVGAVIGVAIASAIDFFLRR